MDREVGRCVARWVNEIAVDPNTVVVQFLGGQ